VSPRAAWRLKRLGFTDVYDYTAGKVDWMAAGLPTVRADRSERRALELVDRHPATCAPDTPLHDLPDGQSVIVVNEEEIVLGRVDRDQIGGPDRTAEEAMHPGPTTVRADEPLDPLLERMRKANVTEMIVSTPEGRLLGVIRLR